MKKTRIVMRILIALGGGWVGFQLRTYFRSIWVMLQWDQWLSVYPWRSVAIDAAVVFIFGLIFYFIAPLILSGIQKLIQLVEKILQRVPLEDVIIGSGGLIVGLLVANLMGLALNGIPVFGSALVLLVNVILGFLGLRLALYQKNDVMKLFGAIKRDKNDVPASGSILTASIGSGKAGECRAKLLDTSVIIDGRIADLCATGFLEGPLVVPLFVLTELQLLSDSTDPIKRARGRRGFDILNRIQKEINFPVIITEKDYENDNAVDSKLIKLSQETGYKLLTLDYNLNKMSVLQQVQVLNINDLANALRTIVLPGEMLTVTILKVGREAGQGIAYLDDGTMVVVDGASRIVGKTLSVEVTTSLQTSAGRMIFAKTRTNN
ncbi:MAG: TRAM domain-containing protein [Negativicutes bacterium]|nr:TRAM domain-containing protein [Negativicutes bacterium]